jgi:hypothetical protein
MAKTTTGSDTTEMGMINLQDTAAVDVEQRAMAEAHLMNTTVRNFTWRGVTVTVKDRETKQPKVIVDNCEGLVEAGKIANLSGRSWSAVS